MCLGGQYKESIMGSQENTLRDAGERERNRAGSDNKGRVVTAHNVPEEQANPFVRRAWYCAAWADELSENLLARRILDEPLVMFRDEDGKPHAISDICPHKFAPLHLGKRLAHTIQ